MAEFVQSLRSAAHPYLDRPVVDLTGISGSFNFSLAWNGSGITVFEAVDKYLGLKLAGGKHPLAVYMIDSINRVPTEN
jgi:uncharacterized protein (TIGR03435 family)